MRMKAGKRKRLALLAVSAMALTMLSSVAFAAGTAEDMVARLNDGTTYPTVQGAVDAAAEKDTVLLLQDTNENIIVHADKEIVLDLNGKTLRSQNETKNTVENYGVLTIQDSTVNDETDEGDMGTIIGIADKIALVNETDATCTIQSGRITRAPYLTGGEQNNNQNSNYTVQNKGQMFIKGGLIVNNSTYNPMVVNFKKPYYAKKDAVKMEISGGTLRQDTCSVLRNDPNAVMTIKENASIINSTSSITQFYGKVKVEGGTFSGGALWVCSVEDNDGSYPTEVNITGGEITVSSIYAIHSYGKQEPVGKPKATLNISGEHTVINCQTWEELEYKNDYNLAPVDNHEMAEISISGGIYTYPVKRKHCADSCIPMKNEMGAYSVTDHISLNATTLSMTVGHTASEPFRLLQTPEILEMEVNWGSSNEDVVTVDDNGIVTAIGAGTAAITATVGGKTAVCIVTVAATTVPASSDDENVSDNNTPPANTSSNSTSVDSKIKDNELPLAQPDNTDQVAPTGVPAIPFASAILLSGCGLACLVLCKKRRQQAD